METRVDKVAEKHKSGYNCAQAVACAYCDLVGIDEETMFRIAEGFGFGMGLALEWAAWKEHVELSQQPV